MSLPLQITFRNIHPSDPIEKSIRERRESLDRFSDRIIGCRVRFHEEAGEKGPQASTVHVEEKRSRRLISD